MMKFEDGDIILTKVNKFDRWYKWLLAKCIQLFDGCYYHHAQIFFEGKLWEANETIKASEPVSNLGKNIIVLRLHEPMTYTERNKARILFKVYSGARYDFAGTMLHQLLYIFSLRRIWIGRTGKRARRRMYCTELVTTVMYQLRGYFPEKHKIGPYRLLGMSPLYYKAVYEGVYYTG